MSRSFNGSSDFLGRDDAVVTAAPFTVAGWVNFTGAGTSTVFNISDSATNGEVFRVTLLQIGGSDSRFVAVTSSAGSTGTAQSTLNVFASTNTWFHVAAVYASNISRTIYVDGANNATDTTDLTPIALGINRTRVASRLAASFFPGLIGVLGVWTLALSGAEVATLAGGALPPTVQGASLNNYWPLCGVTSPEPDLGTANQALTVDGAIQGTDPPAAVGACATASASQSFLALLGVGIT